MMEFYLGKNNVGQEFEFRKNNEESMFKLYIQKNSVEVECGALIGQSNFTFNDKYIYSLFISGYEIYNFLYLDGVDKYLQEKCGVKLSPEIKDYFLSEEIMSKLID